MKVDPKDIVIESGSASWDINTSEAIGGTYMGTFKFRCVLSPMQIIEANRDYRELLGIHPASADPTADNLAYALSQLRQRVILAPPFWELNQTKFGGSNVKDIGVIDLVLEASFAAEVKYREELKQKHSQSLVRLKQALEDKFKQEEENNKVNEELNSLDELSDLPAEPPPKKKTKVKSST